VLLNVGSGRAGPRFKHFVPGSSFLISLCLASSFLAFLFLGSLGVTGIESPRRSRQSSGATRLPTVSPPASFSWRVIAS